MGNDFQAKTEAEREFKKVWETPMVGINLVTERLEAQKRNGA